LLDRRDSEAKYRSLTDELLVEIYRTTSEGRVLRANPACMVMLGFSSMQALLAIESAEAP